MVVISSSGSDFSESSPAKDANFLQPYLRTIFGFVGITDITFVHANAQDVPGGIREIEFERARAEATGPRHADSSGRGHAADGGRRVLTRGTPSAPFPHAVRG